MKPQLIICHAYPAASNARSVAAPHTADTIIRTRVAHTPVEYDLP